MHHKLKNMPNMNQTVLYITICFGLSLKEKNWYCMPAWHLSPQYRCGFELMFCTFFYVRYASNSIYQNHPLSWKASTHPCVLALHVCPLSTMRGIAQLTAVFALQTLYWSNSPLSLPPVWVIAGTCQQDSVAQREIVSCFLLPGRPMRLHRHSPLIRSGKSSECWREITEAACVVRGEGSLTALTLWIH